MLSPVHVLDRDAEFLAAHHEERFNPDQALFKAAFLGYGRQDNCPDVDSQHHGQVNEL